MLNQGDVIISSFYRLARRSKSDGKPRHTVLQNSYRLVCNWGRLASWGCTNTAAERRGGHGMAFDLNQLNGMTYSISHLANVTPNTATSANLSYQSNVIPILTYISNASYNERFAGGTFSIGNVDNQPFTAPDGATIFGSFTLNIKLHNGSQVIGFPQTEYVWGFTKTQMLVYYSTTPGGNPTWLMISDSAITTTGPNTIPATTFGSDLADFTAPTPSCFATGTRIRTPSGDVPVEALRGGDHVLTADGTAQPVVWIGHRHVACHRHPRPRQVLPVRIAAGAFGDGLPCRDLILSPDHAVFIEDVLIPVQYLVNGRTITVEQVEAVTYYHVELPRHDLLLAEGLAVESFLDTGNRADFDNAGAATRRHPSLRTLVWEAEGYAPLVVTGPPLAAARARLARQSASPVRADDNRLRAVA